MPPTATTLTTTKSKYLAVEHFRDSREPVRSNTILFNRFVLSSAHFRESLRGRAFEVSTEYYSQLLRQPRNDLVATCSRVGDGVVSDRGQEATEALEKLGRAFAQTIRQTGNDRPLDPAR